MLIVKNISKIYKNNAGNFNISLEIKENEIYGIMGPNGAGKSTFIKQVLGFIKPDTGEILIDGKDPFKNNKEVMLFSGYIPGEIALYSGLTGIQYLKIINKLKDKDNWEYIEKLLLFFQLDANKKINKMSSGMKQKLAIIASIMHKPRFLVLDEPTRGLDAAISSQFYELILKFKSEYNATIIICSHIFDEISKMCNRVGFIKNGKLIKEYNVNETSMKEINKEFIELFKTQSVEDLI
ncbi:ABC transporter ATP-binding protein [Spiroplasma diminutum]|uniref:ABC transporter ATP-binding protein n=1 Tax=Spiroplasma diminutum CUAS-1 TaxID=1276221 RepID=S5MEF6_9MOLU|nr:ABC transporter ATP-binding protein [Spiroplasma diminutum]AGR42128.1 ABC transporter ATP-binding protein [Spiroplasma diminutum CUAS-1]